MRRPTLISLPSLQALRVDGYGLYPGSDAQPGLRVDLEPGLTLALGANGLGKTTLVTIMYRLLTGPTELSKLPDEGTLGSSRIETRTLQGAERTIFGVRVVDMAKGATATLNFRLGGSYIEVERGLDRLTLRSWSIDGQAQDADEGAYQHAVARLAGMSTFGDWILALRHLVFYFEDRRALVWDPSAQRQLLRFLFLPPEQAQRWLDLERQVLSLDSEVRNANWQHGKEQKLVNRAAAAQGSAGELRGRLAELTAQQAEDADQLAEFEEQLVGVAAERQDARVAALTSAHAHESAQAGVERLQLEVVAAAFPSASTTARYVLGQILSGTTCLVCLNDVPEYRAQVEQRLRDSDCPVCASPVADDRPDGAAATAALQDAAEQARAAGAQRDAAARRREEAEAAYAGLLDSVAALQAAVAARDAEIAETLRRLPQSEQDLREHQSTLASLGARLAAARAELEQRRAQFDEFVRGVNVVIAQRKDAVKEAFDAYAQAFLVESVELVWQPRRDRVGQSGALVEFPAFALDMSSATTASPVRRSGPDNVSESQREFIDLSFRMALMDVASDGGSTLVVDAPESSIDAVFASRAADVLMRFAARKDNRIIVTSNLVDGELVPRLLRLAGIGAPGDPRVVDLLEIASPTAATRAFAADYQRAKERLFDRAAAP